MLHMQEVCKWQLRTSVKQLEIAWFCRHTYIEMVVYSDSRLPSFSFTGFGKTSFSLSDDFLWYTMAEIYSSTIVVGWTVTSVLRKKKREQPTCTAFHTAAHWDQRCYLLSTFAKHSNLLCIWYSGYHTLLLPRHGFAPALSISPLHATACLDKNMAITDEPQSNACHPPKWKPLFCSLP